jgi:hypothetical protein
VVRNDPHLTDYKVPKSVEFKPELPHTCIGNVLRRQLRNEPKKVETGLKPTGRANTRSLTRASQRTAICRSPERLMLLPVPEIGRRNK